MDTYNEQAEEFLKSTNTELNVTFLFNGPYWDNETDHRDVFQFTLVRGKRSYTSKYDDSIMNTQKRKLAQLSPYSKDYTPEMLKVFNARNLIQMEHYHKKIFRELRAWYKENKTPTAYDILTCLTKSEVGTFEDFCAEYGYDTDSRKAFDTYQAVLKEWHGIRSLWNDEELERLQEIS